MIPVYRTRHPENAVTALLDSGLKVLVNCVYENYERGHDMRVRFRADLVRDERIFFAKVYSQQRRWKERGGAIIAWTWAHSLAHYADAIVYQECPKSMEMLWKSAEAGVLAVVYQPPSWIAYETILRERKAGKPKKLSIALTKWATVRDYVDGCPRLTSQSLGRLLARMERARSSPSRGSPAGAVRSPDTTG